MTEKLLSTGEIAKLLDVTPRYAQKLCASGYFGEAAFRIGKRWRVAAWVVREKFHLDRETAE